MAALAGNINLQVLQSVFSFFFSFFSVCKETFKPEGSALAY